MRIIKKKKKKGFTLVELLATIVIIALIAGIAGISISTISKNARRNMFILGTKNIYRAAIQKNFFNTKTAVLFSTGSLDVDGGEDIEYSISTNTIGQIICFQAANEEYMWIYRNKGFPLASEDDVAREEELADRDDEVILDCSGSQLFDSTIPATLGHENTWWEGHTDKSTIERIIFTYSYTDTDYEETFYSDEEKVGGLTTYVKDNIAYVVINRNKRKSKAIKMPENSANTFAGFTNLKNISGLKLLDFSNVTNMDNFFGRYNGDGTVNTKLTYINGYESFNTSKVTSAKYAFAGVNVSSIDLSNWNTSSLNDATGMFYKSNASFINLSSWTVGNITNYTDMFAGNTRIENISLVGWNTNSSANYTGMFNDCTNLISISADTGFTVGNTNVVMFRNTTKIIGSRGTTYVNDKSLYARVDTDSTPGYLSISTSDGIVSAKLYDTGTVSGSYTELTNSGAVPPDWNYYSGARLLEVKLFSMKKNSTKTLEISVPAGMYILSNSWTKSGNGISNVQFTKLANQGTGSYSNSQTGTLKYTFSNSATTSNIQLLVMFDTAIWDKNKKNAATMGTDNMTVSAPIVVNYNNGSTVRKISNIHSATGIGNANVGYSFYSSNYNSLIFTDEPTTLLSSNYLLSSDQSSVPYFYKKITYETYATFTNNNNETVYADVETDVIPSQLSNNVATGSTDKLFKGEWNNVYFSGAASFPRLKYTVKESDNPKVGTNLSVRINATVTTLSGQKNTFSVTKTYTIKSKNLDLNDLIIGSGNKTSPSEIFYGNSGYSGILGIFTMYNRGYEGVQNVKVVFEYDTGTAKNQPPAMKVMAARPFLQNGQEVNAKITLVNSSGSEAVAESYKIKSTNTNNGAYVAASSVASSLGLSGYYFKKIEYTIPVVSGVNKTTKNTNYLYNSSGNSSQSSGGNFMGVISRQATSKCSIYYNDTLLKSVTSTSGVTSSPGFSGYVERINTPLGTEFNAGDNIELAINAASVSYPYTNTQAFRRPEVYLVLPFGINVSKATIGNSSSSTSGDVEARVTKVKTITIGDDLNNVYKIDSTADNWFGYLNITSSSAAGGQYVSKWFKVKMTTDISMEYTSINLRDRVFFKDYYGHISIGGSYAQYSISDKYDVDNDGSTGDKYGTTNKPNQIINIYSIADDTNEEEEEE